MANLLLGALLSVAATVCGWRFICEVGDQRDPVHVLTVVWYGLCAAFGAYIMMS